MPSTTDAIVHKGKVFAVTSRGNIYVWDMRAGSCPDEPELVLPPHHDRNKYENHWDLAESADGRRLLLVCTYGSQVEYKRLCSLNTYFEGSRFQAQGVRLFEAQGVRLFELDVHAAAGLAGDDGWTPVASLGDHSLFLGTSYPFMARVVNRGSSDSSDCAEQLKANCVCVTTESSLFQEQDLEYDMEVFDLGADKYWDHPRKLFSFSRYCKYQTPMWSSSTIKER
ncbi:hypothetical protein BAE44_0002563 [Dichanthelium oligosanthes]|uniref:KIB1-4 beta-propeller domain-containing protein n=1 Tax=Dichanthelium oligosanthes TaxID=888268 RepID=A0A1E5WGD2_9POAL|nr:hypothetical protein BAE44_0002563 [Dichanthelium oligosanthes]